jgi:hypothetical protein
MAPVVPAAIYFTRLLARNAADKPENASESRWPRSWATCQKEVRPTAELLAVLLAFFFGYALTLRPLLAAGLPLSRAVRTALASDTASIAVMEIVDNAVVLVVPGAMEADIGDLLFWGV